MITEKAYAKVNLTLDVGLRRDDGYHPVESVMQTITLFDTLEMEKSDVIEISGNLPFFDYGKSNLAYKAAEAFGRYTGKSGMKLYLEKRIPFKAGLGGGSADAAAVLRGLDRLYSTGLGADVLREIAAMVGSDVPFCIEGGTAKATGRGEIIEEIRQLDDLYFAVAMGGEGLSTAEIYERFDKSPDLSSSTEKMVKAIENGEKIFGLLYNGLEKAASKKIDISSVKSFFRRYGAYDALMTGSGAAIYGVFLNKDEADLASETLKEKGFYCVSAKTAKKITIT